MKFKSRKSKPATEMEMSVTLMMPAGQTAEESSAALISFFESVTAASNAIGAAWLKVNCSNIPEELESALQTAFDKMNQRPQLKLVIDNPSAIRAAGGSEKLRART